MLTVHQPENIINWKLNLINCSDRKTKLHEVEMCGNVFLYFLSNALYWWCKYYYIDGIKHFSLYQTCEV